MNPYDDVYSTTDVVKRPILGPINKPTNEFLPQRCSVPYPNGMEPRSSSIYSPPVLTDNNTNRVTYAGINHASKHVYANINLPPQHIYANTSKQVAYSGIMPGMDSLFMHHLSPEMQLQLQRLAQPQPQCAQPQCTYSQPLPPKKHKKSSKCFWSKK